MIHAAFYLEVPLYHLRSGTLLDSGHNTQSARIQREVEEERILELVFCVLNYDFEFRAHTTVPGTSHVWRKSRCSIAVSC
jgi:hypothetical protein